MPPEQKQILTDVLYAEGPYLLRDAIDSASHIIKARLKAVREYEELRYYVFEFKENILGTFEEQYFIIQDDYIELPSVPDGAPQNNLTAPYELEKEYILFLERSVSVYDEEDSILLKDRIFMEVSGDTIQNIVFYGDESPKDLHTLDDLRNYCTEVSENQGTIYGTPYSKSTNIDDIIAFSPYIAEVRIIEKTSNTPEINRDQYLCEIITPIKGTFDEGDYDPDNITVILLKNTVKIGKKYILMLDKPGEYSSFYTISSKNSVYKANDRKVLAALENHF